MKNWKALFGTVVETISGSKPRAFQTMEDWNNLWQVIDELKKNQNTRVYHWECLSQRAFDRGDIKIHEWYGEKIYSGDLLISMEFKIGSLNEKCIYIRRGYAQRIKTPVEKALNLETTFAGVSRSSPYVLYLTDYRGELLHSYPVIHWLELLDIWSTNGVLKALPE